MLKNSYGSIYCPVKAGLFLMPMSAGDGAFSFARIQERR